MKNAKGHGSDPKKEGPRPVPDFRFKPSRREIVQQVIKEHGLRDGQFFGTGRTKDLVAARVDAMLRLKEDGAYHEEIARHIKRNVSFVLYHRSEENRLRRKLYHQRRYREKTNAKSPTTNDRNRGDRRSVGIARDLEGIDA